ncbi:MAG: hypothetical protein KDJ25_15930 [Rhodoblastus sp.]|nr:hypothetical protein [Rhodoblastus sp.]
MLPVKRFGLKQRDNAPSTFGAGRCIVQQKGPPATVLARIASIDRRDGVISSDGARRSQRLNRGRVLEYAA